jgi:hypothetical protein
MKYILIGDDMFCRTLEGLLLKCLGPTEANRLLREVHEGACGTHQSAHKMKWLIRRSGYYWPTMLEDSFKYYQGCQACHRYKAMKYVLIGDDMFCRTLEGLLLKCLGSTEANRLLHEVHEGACGTHQSAHKMKWLIRRSGYYWPTMLEDSFKYYQGCQAYQTFRKIQMVPASVMNPIIKPWPFRGWGMDMIGKINPPSSKGHQYILAIMDYFTKWVENIPMKSVTSKDVVNFIKEHVIHRFGIP